MLLVAILYYIFNLQTTMKLEDPIYFNKDAWIALIKEVRSVHIFINCFTIGLINVFEHSIVPDNNSACLCCTTVVETSARIRFTQIVCISLYILYIFAKKTNHF